MIYIYTGADLLNLRNQIYSLQFYKTHLQSEIR